ncbi:MAG TPA: hypothetical protein DDX54_01310 [Rhodospirillaceae bacterium]|nr:hypothetical protein [Rhodospirillaceae bacterium]
MAEAGARGGLVIRDVLVTGRAQTEAEDLRRAVGAEKGAPLLAFDPVSAQRAVAALPWVSAARVERRAGGVIAVALAERVAVARWAEGPGAPPVLIDAQGTPIVAADGQFDDLPLLMGLGAPEEAGTVLALLAAEPGVARRTAYAERISRRRWDLVLTNGARVLLPAADPAPALARVLFLQDREKILDTPRARIDARREGEVIIRDRMP